ncbi:hypothetical protein Tco_1532848 [Tanacetum coccineum]
MSKRARTGKGTRGQASSSQEPTIKDKVCKFGVFDNDTHQGYYDTFSRHPIHPESVIDWAFPYPLCSVACRVGLYSEEQSRLSSIMSGLRRGETIKDEHVLMQFWPYIGDDDFVVRGMAIKKVREDDEVEETANEEAGGSAEVYRNMSRGDWKIRQARKNTLFSELSFLFFAAAYFALDFSLSYVPLSFLITFLIMAKKDMDLYHSRLTQDDLNDLIIKYKIPCDLHPWLLFEEFVMSELPNDAIGINHRMFDFFSVRMPFSLFLLALIKHYRVHFSQLGPVGLNKVITFKVLCRSLQLESTVNLFRVFQTLYKQGDWFSFAKRRAPSLVSIDDPRPVAGSFNMANVRHLSAHVVKLRDMPEGVLVLSGLTLMLGVSICDPVLRGADRNGQPFKGFPFIVLLLLRPMLLFLNLLWRILLWNPCFKIVARLKLLPEGIRLYFGAALSHVAKLTRSALAQSSGSTNRPSLFVGDSDDESDGDDDACVEIPLVTPLRSATVIHPSGNQGRSSTAPAAEGSNARDSRGKGIMVDDAAAPSSGVSRPRSSFGPAPSFRDVSGGAIHTDFFPFSTCPYYATYPEDGVAGNCEFTREE